MQQRDKIAVVEDNTFPVAVEKQRIGKVRMSDLNRIGRTRDGDVAGVGVRRSELHRGESTVGQIQASHGSTFPVSAKAGFRKLLCNFEECI